AELRLREIAENGNDAIYAAAGTAPKLVELSLGARADEHVDCSRAREQPFDEVTPDEARGAGQEVSHAVPLVGDVVTLVTFRAPKGRGTLLLCHLLKGDKVTTSPFLAAHAGRAVGFAIHLALLDRFPLV